MTDVLNGKYFLHFHSDSGEIELVAKLISPISDANYYATLLDITSGEVRETTNGLICIDDDIYSRDQPHLIFDTEEELLEVLKKLKVIKEVHEQKKKFMLSDLIPGTTVLENKPSV